MSVFLCDYLCACVCVCVSVHVRMRVRVCVCLCGRRDYIPISFQYIAQHSSALSTSKKHPKIIKQIDQKINPFFNALLGTARRCDVPIASGEYAAPFLKFPQHFSIQRSLATENSSALLRQ